MSVRVYKARMLSCLNGMKPRINALLRQSSSYFTVSSLKLIIRILHGLDWHKVNFVILLVFSFDIRNIKHWLYDNKAHTYLIWGIFLCILKSIEGINIGNEKISVFQHYSPYTLRKEVQLGTLFVPYLEPSGERVPKRVLYMFKNLKRFRM